jgi:hypothetical protein
MTSRLFAALFLLALVAPVDAQQAELSGFLKDVNDRALPGVRVELVREGTSTRRETVTDRQGRFTIARLEPGVHSVSFDLPGFEPVRRSNIAVGAGAAIHLGEVLLRVGALRESIAMPAPLLPRRDMRAECLHGRDETEAERQRRAEAFAAVRLIAGLLERVPVSPLGYPDWQTLARSKAVMDLRSGTGAAAELARKIQWGDAEPLPGWTLTYVRSQFRVRFALSDSRDPCGFSYDSDQLGDYGRVLPLQ